MENPRLLEVLIGRTSEHTLAQVNKIIFVIIHLEKLIPNIYDVDIKNRLLNYVDMLESSVRGLV